MSIKDFFNKLADKWDKLAKHDKVKLKKIINFLSLKEGQIVMDVGCGTGIMLPLLKEHVGRKGCVYAVDVSEKMLKKARTKHKGRNIYFVNSDVCSLPFTPESFDAVLCYSSFPHFKDREKALKSLSKVLKPKGKLIVAHSDSKKKINRVHREAGKDVKDDIIPSKNKMKALFKDVNLKIKEFIDDDKMYLIKAEKP
ncbi:MAG: class I SAM-dependent methyltransferase [Armatimonadota bacterium]